MQRVKGIFAGIHEKIDGFFYKCEYLKECDKVGPQCWEGGNSYCGEWRKRSRQKNKK